MQKFLLYKQLIGALSFFCSQAVHKATLDVDEAGAEATAVTGIGFTLFSARITNPLKFDRPFMIFIVDQKTKNVLFMGKIVNPANSEVNQ